MQLRRGTATAWSAANPILKDGEPGVEDPATAGQPAKFKIGDGTTAWNALPYQGAGSGLAADPSSAGVAQTMSRNAATNVSVQPATGTMYLTLMAVRSGVPINHLTVVPGGAAAVSPTNAWMALYRQSDGVRVGLTNDLTTTAWAANGAAKQFDLAAAYTPPSDLAVYVGIVIVASTAPTLVGANVAGKVSGLAPVLAANGPISQTTPGNAPTTITAPTAGTGGIPFYCSAS